MISKKYKISIDDNLVNLSQIFSKNNQTLYIVGGYVRDSLLNKNPYDIDICSSVTIENLQKLLINTNYLVKIKNKIFGTAQIEIDNCIYEYTCFRKETYDLTGSHSPKKVEFISSIALDAQRRDFYINALYYDIEKNEIVDPLEKGLIQLENKIICQIKHKPNKFKEDATRILRMFKFSVILNFEIDSLSLFYAKSYAHLLKNISKQRINKELEFLSSCSAKQQEKFNNYIKICKIQIK